MTKASVFPKQFSEIMYFSEHICPKGLSWAPRFVKALYISSVCGDKGNDGHVYTVNLDFEKPKYSEIVKTYTVLGSRSFDVCGQNSLINVIDSNKGVIFSFATDLGLTSQEYLPTKVYGIDSIRNYVCDQENGILQILAVMKDQVKLVTYRADNYNDPLRRVHSIKEVDPATRLIAATFTNEGDQTFTITGVNSLSDIKAVRVSVDGPHLYFDGTATIAGTYSLKIQVEAPGETSKKYIGTVNFRLEDQKTDLTVALVDKDNKPKVQESQIDLEKYLLITGPYHSLGAKSVEGIQLFDRLSPSNQFDTMISLFDNAVLYKDMVFGYKKDGAQVTTKLVQGDKTIIQLDNTPSTTLFVIPRSSDSVYFFSYVPRPLELDQLISVYTLDGGKTWKTAMMTLQYQGFDYVKIISGGGSSFIFAAANNMQQYSIITMVLTITDDKINQTASFRNALTDNIALFDIVWVGGSNYFLLAGTQFDSLADIFYLQTDDKT